MKIIRDKVMMLELRRQVKGRVRDYGSNELLIDSKDETDADLELVARKEQGADRARTRAGKRRD